MKTQETKKVKITSTSIFGLWYEQFFGKVFTVKDTEYDYFEIPSMSKIIYKEHCEILPLSMSKEKKLERDKEVIHLFKSMQDNRSCTIADIIGISETQVNYIITDYYRKKLSN